MKPKNTITLCLILTVLTAPWVGPIIAGATLDDVRKQLETAAHLIEDSSASKRVVTSDNAAAQALHAQARALFRRATDAHASGNGASALELLSEAKKIMFKAVQSAGSGGGRTDKAKHDYEMRALSVIALLKAQTKVVEEKHAEAGESPMSHQVEMLLEEAGTFYQNGDYSGGRQKLDLAYEKVKLSIERMRTGETLVNKVEFHSIEEEYQYYSDKTKSQYEAITLVAQTVAGTPREKSIKLFSIKMQDARKQAGELAIRGDYEQAVEVLLPIFKSAPYQLMSLLQ